LITPISLLALLLVVATRRNASQAIRLRAALFGSFIFVNADSRVNYTERFHGELALLPLGDSTFTKHLQRRTGNEPAAELQLLFSVERVNNVGMAYLGSIPCPTFCRQRPARLRR
jgi:hypothetical protein